MDSLRHVPPPAVLSALSRPELEALLIELFGEVAALKQTIIDLREEIARLKGLKGRPTIKPSGMDQGTEPPKPGKREKIRYGQAPSKTLPTAPATAVEDAGGGAGGSASTAVASATPEPANPLDASNKPTEKTRFSDRAKEPKKPKYKGPQLDSDAPPPPDAAEIADRQEQAAALGQNGDTSAKKKKKSTTTATDKTRLADKNKKPDEAAPAATPSAPAPQAPPPQ